MVGDQLVTPSSWDWILSQVRWLVKEKPDATLSVPTSVPNVFSSFGGIPGTLTEQLNAAADKLADEQGDDFDWHPGSNKTVLDLVHPSLYPHVIGRTAVKDREIGRTAAKDRELSPVNRSA